MKGITRRPISTACLTLDAKRISGALVVSDEATERKSYRSRESVRNSRAL